MAKAKSTAFFCKECGFESAKWMGQCPGCKEWNTFVEEPVRNEGKGRNVLKSVQALVGEPSKPRSLSQVSLEENDKIYTRIKELDRVLGGGIVPGALVLVGGDPGIGKSTLLLQVCKNLSDDSKKVLYVSGEESLKQIKIRAMRIGSFTENLLLLC